MFLNNKYTNCYYRIIYRAQNRINTPGIKYDTHHIIPKCIGGSNNESNLVKLTHREHFICHLLLLKMVPSNIKSKLVFAFNIMSNTRRHNSRIFSTIREEHSKIVSNLLKNKPKSAKHKLNMRGKRPHVIQSGSQNNAFRGWYITPWGEFDSAILAAKECPFKIKTDKIYQACKSLNSSTIKVNRDSNFPVGVTYKELGYGFRVV